MGNHRGGTTLLQAMLSSHSAITIPPETGFFAEVWPRRKRFGDLSVPQNLERMFDFLESDFCSVSDLRFNRECVMEGFRQTDQTCADLFVALLSDYAVARGKRRAGEKSPQHIFCVPTLAELYPQARFITLIRDPRGVVCSELQTAWGSKSVGRIARKWCRTVDQHERLRQQQPPGRYLQIRYEDLLSSPETVLRRACEFLGEEFEPAMLTYFERPEAERGFRTDEIWKANTLRPLEQQRVAAWQQVLGPEQIALVERWAGGRMANFGYEPAGCANVSARLALQFRIADRIRWTSELLSALVRPRRRRTPWMTAIAEAAFSSARVSQKDDATFRTDKTAARP